MGTKRKFTEEFKLSAVALADRGERSILSVANDLGIHHTVLRDWVTKFGTKDRDKDQVVTPSDRAELIRLRKEVLRLTEEREILKKAMGIFTRELP